MRADFELQPFRSAGAYGTADIVSLNVRGGGDMSEYFTDLFETPAKLFRPHKDTLLHGAVRGIDYFYTEYWTYKFPTETARRTSESSTRSAWRSPTGCAKGRTCTSAAARWCR